MSRNRGGKEREMLSAEKTCASVCAEITTSRYGPAILPTG